MDWQKHFHNLKGLKQKKVDEYHRVIERKTAEMQRTHKIYSHQIEKVCRGFAKATGLTYEGMEQGWVKATRPYEFYCVRFKVGAYEVILERDFVYISVERISPDLSLHERIPVAEFTQEKLAEILKKFFKECLG